MVVGHRGAGEALVSGVAENTAASCLEAHARGASWVELDARLTRDGELVLHHDHLLTDGRPVDEVSAVEARDAGLERLEDVLAALPPQLGVDLEIKVALRDAGVAHERTTAGRVAAHALALEPARPVVLTSFNPAAVLAASAVAGGALPVGLLGMPITPVRELVPAALALGADVICPHVVATGLVDVPGLPMDGGPRVLEALGVAREHGLETLVWGARAAQVPDLLALGVDALCVDEIAETVAALDVAGRVR